MQFSFSDDKIEELRQLAEEEFGESATHDEAKAIANSMLELYRLLSDLGQNATNDSVSQSIP